MKHMITHISQGLIVTLICSSVNLTAFALTSDIPGPVSSAGSHQIATKNNWPDPIAQEEGTTLSRAKPTITVKNSISNVIDFQIQRDTSNRESFNKAIQPAPVHVTIESFDGQPLPSLEITPSPYVHQYIQVTNLTNSGTKMDFDVDFIGYEAILDDYFNFSEQKNESFLLISDMDSGQEVERLTVYFSAEGAFSFYSAEQRNLYSSMGFSSNPNYVLVGTIDLNESKPEPLQVKHRFFTVNTQESPIDHLELFEESAFQFENGSSIQTVPGPLNHNDMISAKINMKPAQLREWKKVAKAGKRDLNLYYVLNDLTFHYEDGYVAGGSATPLPLAYRIIYSYDEQSGGSGGGGGGGGTSSTGINKPAMTARTNRAASNDIGWVKENGIWHYYKDFETMIYGWLLDLDGRWYFLNSDGKMKTGWCQVDNTWYFLNADGAMATGWVMPGQETWYYLDGSGKMLTGWIQVQHSWYYLNPDGSLLVNSTTPDGYFVGADGTRKS